MDTKNAIFGVMSNEFIYNGFCKQSAIDVKIKQDNLQNCTAHMDGNSTKKMVHNMKK